MTPCLQEKIYDHEFPHMSWMSSEFQARIGPQQRKIIVQIYPHGQYDIQCGVRNIGNVKIQNGRVG